MDGEVVTEFCFDRERAAADLQGSQHALWPVNQFSGPDELNQLLDAAQNSGLVVAPQGARLFIYPLSICEPAPLIAVSPPSGPTMLGVEVTLAEHDGEDLICFTVRLLERLIGEGNALFAKASSDSSALDRIAAFMNRPGPWNGGDVCELVATELQESGREVLDNADD